MGNEEYIKGKWNWIENHIFLEIEKCTFILWGLKRCTFMNNNPEKPRLCGGSKQSFNLIDKWA
jgi:hypothetical protein